MLSFVSARGFGAGDPGFRKVAKPFLAKHCNACHSTKAKVANLDLERFRTVDAVLAEQELWDKAARKIRTGEMPPKGRPAPSNAEVDGILTWLTNEYARYDKSVRPDPGRVTARRLNRAEYNNTIRDLVGIDLRPAETFPVDDSGYGFDNIGDVLSMSPALMEKYMIAASRIAKAAIAVPRTFKETSDRYRSDRVKHNGPVGSLEVKHSFPVEADYELRIAIAGRRAIPEDGLRIVALIDGKEERTFDIVAPPNRPRVLDLKIRPKAGPHTLRAHFIDAQGKVVNEDRGMLVEYLDVRGPYNPAPFEPPPSHAKVLICGEWPGKYDDACLRQIVAEFTRRAFRRPVTPQEVDSFYRYVKVAKDDGESAEVALRYALQAVLVSPQFLFRIERHPKPTDPKASHVIGDFELATRLSYFLWASMPDETLYQLAQQKQLRKPGVLEQQVDRMIADAKFAGFVDNFLGQWLELRNLDEVKPAPEKFPEFDTALRAAMKKETQLFFEHVARNDQSILQFLNSDYTFLNARLARHYGISEVEGDDFRMVKLATAQRGGILTHASLLTVSSYPNRTSPVLRGKFLLENFLNAPPPPPPPNVPTLEEQAATNKGSLRQQMEKHRTNAVCASCHSRMDALGFGLENYDAVGKWRDRDGEFSIDSSGELPGQRKFASPAELKSILMEERNDFAMALAEKMIIYALGRGLERNDRPQLRQIVRNLAASGYKFKHLVMEIVKSAPFQMRRGEGGKS
ncbi:MAG: DUF1592 domain-containing protein [Bryobacterales bacterium]|nr:DUF1592 domain-containing protein [Bryobacterales bacterium]